jgi:DNA-binding PadR family transcriptional regulator
MSVGMSLLTILDEGPNYGLRLKQEFEARTGGVWPLNVGQVYTTLDRLERDGLVQEVPEASVEGQKMHRITQAGHDRLKGWFERPAAAGQPPRDELVLKLVMAARHPGIDAAHVIQTERKGAVQMLQEFTQLKRDAPTDADLGWSFLVDSLIFRTEARVRWLDTCEARLQRAATEDSPPAPMPAERPTPDPSEVSR